ncbi:hypothetical protein [Alienimonas californiensis]|uniref:Uncharacterized protein n=1 Tax=Alienimonas californiensis TaxID=2527989 RepID=A0A517P5S9_9PLAN|nr:hypothetical protein [Alienimonas californiensis]QDT14723.1 hypothetical protein CA12_08010 [Alienimonas californiensis]
MPTSPPAVRTLGGRPRASARDDRSRDDARPGACHDARPDRSADESPSRSEGPREDRPQATAERDESRPGADAGDPWEALALAAMRTAVRAVRAADDGWAAKLARVAADPGVREALCELAEAARRAAEAAPPAATDERSSGGASAKEGSTKEKEEEAPTGGAPIGGAPGGESLDGRAVSSATSAVTARIATPAPVARPPAKPSPDEAAAPPPPEPRASLGEIQERLTLGASAAAPAAAAGSLTAELDEASTLQSEDVRGLARIPDRCRTKAHALRWAADRLAAGAETGPLRTRREALEATADPGDALWPLLEPAPPGSAPADYVRAAAVFEVLADAALLLDAALERYLSAVEGDGHAAQRGEELDHLKAALDLTAEAQSMALIVVRNLREKPDRDQVAVYKTIRDISDARTGIAYFIRNYLREGSHADPFDHADLASRIHSAAAARGRGKAEREAFKKFAYAAAKAASHAEDEMPDRFDYHAGRMGKFAARLLALGVPPSDVRFRDAVPDDLAPLRAAARRLADAKPEEAQSNETELNGTAEASAEPGAASVESTEVRAAALARVLEYLPDPAADAEEEDDNADAPAVHRYADSVDAALARAAEEFPQALAFAFNSKSVREGYPYRRPDRVYLGLKFLATTLRDALAGRASCTDLDAECVRQCGLHYSPNQSPSTMGQFPEDYRTVWGGEEVQLTRHLRGGNNKDPRLSIRLAFHYDRAADTIVVGYLGQHQRTRAT